MLLVLVVLVKVGVVWLVMLLLVDRLELLVVVSMGVEGRVGVMWLMV